MIKFVTKKDGTRVDYDAEKIIHGITQAALEAELTESEAASIAKEVADVVSSNLESVEEVTTVELREKILTELDATHPVVAESWKKYEEGKHE